MKSYVPRWFSSMTAKSSLQLYLLIVLRVVSPGWKKANVIQVIWNKKLAQGVNILVRNVFDHQCSARVFTICNAVKVKIKLLLVFRLGSISIMPAAPDPIISGIIWSRNTHHWTPSVGCMIHLLKWWKPSIYRGEHGLPIISSGRCQYWEIWWIQLWAAWKPYIFKRSWMEGMYICKTTNIAWSWTQVMLVHKMSTSVPHVRWHSRVTMYMHWLMKVGP